MALLFIDSFEHYTAPTDLNKKWSSMGTVGITPVVSARNGRGLQFAGGDFSWVLKGLAQKATLLLGVAFKPTALGNWVLAQFWDPGYCVGSICLTAAGAISLVVHNGPASDTVVATSATTPVSAGNWYYLEAKYTLADVGGYIEAKIDQVSAITFTGDTKRVTASPYTQLAGIALGPAVSISGFQGAHTVQHDDVYMLDTLGVRNNDYLGDCRIACLYPDGDGNVNAWTALSGGAHFNEVKEALLDSDTTYEHCATYPLKTLYTFGNLTGSVGSVAGVQTVAAARKTATGGAVYRHVLRTLGTDVEGADAAFTAGSAYDFSTQVYETDSAGVDWSEAKVNAIEAGVNRVA